MMQKPDIDYESILAQQGMPTTQDEILAEFDAEVKKSGLITNTSPMSPFWRLISSIVVQPVIWLKGALINVVMKNMYLATATGTFIDLFARAVNLERKGAQPAAGVIRFTKSDPTQDITVPAKTIIETERINNTVYRLLTNDAVVIAPGLSSALVVVTAENPGKGYNLAPGYYRILPGAIAGIDSAVNEENWLTTPGADTETDDELRDRTRNQFNLPSQYHIDAVYRSMIAGIAELTTDRIFFLHDAPRGPGTANVYLLLESGVASQPFIDVVNDYVMSKGHHGHGDDVLCLPMPETQYDLIITVRFSADQHLNPEHRTLLLKNIENLIRCAFRENGDYDVQKTWPNSVFSMSRLAEELHNHFSEIESVKLSLDDIESALSVPRLKTLVVNEHSHE
ncbi:baseplate J/gp47 family protein [Photorhabdus tasmaniensis]|uniref:Baseplate protein J-like barrel domain-containing protein n=1 Tax=Photorhabdus tasmaniensis TaxID=1004159 RepID=A0ABX0GEJ6_9GAMM|nr:baseplate J/gp47 family protein [Photorhabdus tasmaniensis]NHB87194.1 hypothetical protein [Photorhabdus tasmaniensis]